MLTSFCILVAHFEIVKYNEVMIKIIISFLYLSANAYALDLPQVNLSETLQEQKQGNEFLQIIWNTDTVVADIETQVYLKALGHELSTYSEDPASMLIF